MKSMTLFVKQLVRISKRCGQQKLLKGYIVLNFYF